MAAPLDNSFLAILQDDLEEKHAELMAIESDFDSDPIRREALKEEIENLQSMLIGNAEGPEEHDYNLGGYGSVDTTHEQQSDADHSGSSPFTLPLYGQQNSRNGQSFPGATQNPSNLDGSDDSAYSNLLGPNNDTHFKRPSRPYRSSEMPKPNQPETMPGSWLADDNGPNQSQGFYGIISSPKSEQNLTLNNIPKRRLQDFDAESAHEHPNKSHRTTPSPYTTYDTTPTSFDSFEPDVETTLPTNSERRGLLPENQPVINLSSDPIPQTPLAYSAMSDEEFARVFQREYAPQNPHNKSSSSRSSYLQDPHAMLYPSGNTFQYAAAPVSRSTSSVAGNRGFMRQTTLDGAAMSTNKRPGNGEAKIAVDREVINLDSDSEDFAGSNTRAAVPEIIDLESDDWLDDLSASAMPAFGASSNLYNGNTGTAYYDAAPGLEYGLNTGYYGNDFSATTYANDIFTNAGLDPNADREMYNNYVDRVQYVANDPTRKKDEIKSLLENIRPDEELPPENREGTPEALVYPLMEHQKLGLAWLKKMEASDQSGGILADDMGLGKTIQALALMVSQRSNNPACKTTLIIAPVALMKQWEREIKVKLKPAPHNLTTLVLHGSNRHASWVKLAQFDVVVTTFGVLASELKRYEKNKIKLRADPEWKPTPKDELSLLGDDCYFYRIIIDEAQCIKNRVAKVSLGAALLKAKSRFCMTGTPLMNRVDELYPLLRFIGISPWSDSKYFNTQFTKPLKSQSPAARNQAMKKLQVLLKAVLLRRTKKSLIDGKPILDLPPKNTEHQIAEFSRDEISLYRSLETKSQLQFNKYLKAGLVGKNYSNVLILLLRLRQACCHPYLLRDFAGKEDDSQVSFETIAKLASQLNPDAVIRLKAQIENADDNALDCPICMDVTTDTVVFVPCGHGTCSECFSRLTDPSQAIAVGEAEGENGGIQPGEGKCPSCRAKISPSKVVDIGMFRKVFLPQTIKPDPDAAASADTEDDDSEDSDEDDSADSEDDPEDVDEKGNLKDFVVKDDDSLLSESEENESKSVGALGIKQEEDGPSSNVSKPPKKQSKKSKGKAKSKGKEKEKPGRKTMGQLRKEAVTSKKARRRYLKRLEKDYIPSAKIEKTMEILNKLREQAYNERRPMEKVIIFSQFTSLLDLLQLPVDRARYGYRRYDGSMSSTARSKAIESFTDKHSVNILLTSLKAGNAGLNLTAASQVIMFDPFWNPYIEDQAVDRAHRIGQSKPVQVHRLFIQNTIEDRILTLQEQKRDLIENALDEGESRRIGRLGVKDMAFLFVSNLFDYEFVRVGLLTQYRMFHLRHSTVVWRLHVYRREIVSAVSHQSTLPFTLFLRHDHPLLFSIYRKFHYLNTPA